MDEQEAIHGLEGLTNQMLNEVPQTNEYARGVIKEWMEGAKLHLKAIYYKGMRVGEGFRAIADDFPKEGYEFWMTGIHRHIGLCRNVVCGFNPFYRTQKPKP